MGKFVGLVLLIINNESYRDEMLRELAGLGIGAMAFDNAEEALEEVEFGTPFWLVCFSTDGIKEEKAHDREYVLSYTEKVRNKIGTPLFFVLDDCGTPLKEDDLITTVNSHSNAPALIKTLWDGD